jgi:hypothetical protein
MGAVTLEEFAAGTYRSTLGSKYDLPVNRFSAYEILTRWTLEKETASSEPEQEEAEKPSERRGGRSEWLWGTKHRQGMVETMAILAAHTVGSRLGRQILRGLLVS